MENRLKERLTGAAILVALIVMVVPELFRGQPSDVASFAGSSGEGPPVRSYTIDLSNSPTRASPLQSNPIAGGGSDKAAMAVPVEPVSAPSAAAPPAVAPRATSASPVEAAPLPAPSVAPAAPAAAATPPAAAGARPGLPQPPRLCRQPRLRLAHALRLCRR